MKKIFFYLLLVVFMTTYSCKPEEVEIFDEVIVDYDIDKPTTWTSDRVLDNCS